MTPETQTGALYQTRWVEWGGRFKREGTYIYLWLIQLMFDRKQTKICKGITFQLKSK